MTSKKHFTIGNGKDGKPFRCNDVAKDLEKAASIFKEELQCTKKGLDPSTNLNQILNNLNDSCHEFNGGIKFMVRNNGLLAVRSPNAEDFTAVEFSIPRNITVSFSGIMKDAAKKIRA